MERLPDTNFKTCEEFRHLATACCEICHTFYAHYEMHLEDLPSGEKAWICCSLRRALFEPAKGMDQLLEETVDLERILDSIFGGASELDAPASMKDEDINLKGMPSITDYDNLQQGDGMHTALITHTCGHNKTYSRPSAEALKVVAEYAKTTMCWDCWLLVRAREERFGRCNRFLRRVIYSGLKDLNTGFDSPLIGHFSPADFFTVIDRCESLNVSVIGIQVFSSDVEPPLKVQRVDIEISPEEGYDWTRRLVRKYLGRSDITISATFDVPDALLKSNPRAGR